MARTQGDTGGRAALKNRTPQMTLVLVKVPGDSNRLELDLNLYYGKITLIHSKSNIGRREVITQIRVVCSISEMNSSN